MQVKFKEIQSLSVEELKSQLQEETKRLKELKFAHAITPLDNPMQIRLIRKHIARLHTAIKAKELATSNK
jgi:large subunit ribosomal protein L29